MDNDALMYFYGQKKKLKFKCEVNLVRLCEKFDELYPHCTPAPNNRASWYVGLRRILREFGEKKGVDFIQWSKPQTEKSPHLTIVDAHSIGYLIPQFKKLQMSACQTCREHWSTCQCDWGSKIRLKKYGGE